MGNLQHQTATLRRHNNLDHQRNSPTQVPTFSSLHHSHKLTLRMVFNLTNRTSHPKQSPQGPISLLLLHQTREHQDMSHCAPEYQLLHWTLTAHTSQLMRKTHQEALPHLLYIRATANQGLQCHDSYIWSYCHFRPVLSLYQWHHCCPSYIKIILLFFLFHPEQI